MNRHAFSLPAVLAVALLGAACSQNDNTPATGSAEKVDAAAAPGTAAEPAAAPVVEAQVSSLEVYEGNADPAVGGQCALDAINGAPAANASVSASGEALFAGWISDAQLQVPGKAWMVLKGESGNWAFPVTAGGDRPDVATALGSEALRKAGYNVRVPLSGLPAGRYDLRMVHGEQGNQQMCALNVAITVAP